MKWIKPVDAWFIRMCHTANMWKNEVVLFGGYDPFVKKDRECYFGVNMIPVDDLKRKSTFIY
jgi:hypothetical protein